MRGWKVSSLAGRAHSCLFDSCTWARTKPAGGRSSLRIQPAVCTHTRAFPGIWTPRVGTYQGIPPSNRPGNYPKDCRPAEDTASARGLDTASGLVSSQTSNGSSQAESSVWAWLSSLRRPGISAKRLLPQLLSLVPHRFFPLSLSFSSLACDCGFSLKEDIILPQETHL